MDPISDRFAFVSTYNYAENSPINSIDLHGLQKYEMNSMDPNLRNATKEQKAAFHKGMVDAGATAALMLSPVDEVAAAGFVLSKIPIVARASAAVGGALAKVGGRIKSFFSKSDGFLNKSDFGNLSESGTIDPKSIKFGQESIGEEFQNGMGKVEDLTKGLKDGSINPSDIPAIRIVERNNSVFTLDHRRLKAFQDAGVDVPFKKLDNIPKKELRKFRDYDAGLTDGTKVRVRKKKN